MKIQILLVLLLSIITIFSHLTDQHGETILSITHKQQNKFHFPRSDQSCISLQGNELANSYGWFWNGQICESCSHPYCLCDKNNYCSGCNEGFRRVRKTNAATWATCVRCPTINRVGSEQFKKNNQIHSYLYDSKIHNAFDEKEFLENPEVLECEAFQDLTQSDEWTNSQVYQRWERALRSTKCANNQAGGIQYKLYGSICWYINGCQEYTKYGKCEVCQNGYFKTGDQLCSKCEIHATNLNGKINDYTGSKQHVCDLCNSQGQCTQCSKGYFLVSPFLYQGVKEDAHLPSFIRNQIESINNYRQLTTDNVLDDASWCVECSEGCNCEQPYLTSDNQLAFTSIEPLAGYAVKDAQCYKCNSIEGNIDKYCISCNLNQGFQCTQCQEYFQETNSSNLFDIRYTILVNNKCLKCPENCKACESLITGDVSENDLSCKKDHCFNGFREIKDDKGRITCLKCSTEKGIARCETRNASQEEYPLQCMTKESISENFANLYDNTDLYLSQNFISTDNNNVSINLKPHPQMVFTTYGKSSDTTNLQYHLVINENKDHICQKGIQYCLLLQENDIKKCSRCEKGYKLNEQETCDRIKDESTCSNTNLVYPECNTCIAGYKLQVAKTCVKCNISNCSNCNDNINDCTKCKDGFRVWKNNNTDSNLNVVCETCEYNCKTCEADRKICTECMDDYYLHAGVCHTKTTNCAEYDRLSNKCTVCDYGFRMTLIGEDRFCVQCFSHEIGVVHCPTGCQTASCHYSTVNNDNLDNTGEENEEDKDQDDEPSEDEETE